MEKNKDEELETWAKGDLLSHFIAPRSRGDKAGKWRFDILLSVGGLSCTCMRRMACRTVYAYCHSHHMYC